MILDTRPMPKVSQDLEQAVAELDALLTRSNAARGVKPYIGPERRKWRPLRKSPPKRWGALADVHTWGDALAFVVCGLVGVLLTVGVFAVFVLGVRP